MELKIEIIADADLQEELRRIVDQWTADSFFEQAFFTPDYKWAKPDWHVLVWVGDQVVSCLKVIERTGTVGGHPVKMAGVGDVVTPPPLRRRGYASAAVKAASAFICEKLDAEFGVLMCEEHLVHFYARYGWQRVPEPLQFDEPWGKVTSPEVTMVLPCRGQEWPDGPIDLCGLPW